MNKKISKLLLVILVVSMLAVSLTACGLFSDSTKITKVTIEQISNFADTNSDGIYEAELGKYVTLKADWDNSSTVKSPSIQWYIQEDEREPEAISKDGTDKELSYEIKRRGDIVYTISVVINEIECTTPFKFVVVDAELDEPEIECATAGLTLTQGIIQQNILLGLKNVTLLADSNYEDTDGSDVIVKWYVDNEEMKSAIYDSADSDTYTYTYDVSSILSKCRVAIKCELDDGSEEPLSSIIYLEFIEEFEAVDQISLSSTADQVEDYSIYYVIVDSSTDPGTVSISSSVTPDATDLSRACTWTKTDKNGSTILSSTSREIVAQLTYGKNTFTATIDNVESKQIIVYSLTKDHYKDRESYIKDKFVWDGNDQDHYINNQHDLNMLVGYLVSCHNLSRTDNMYLAPAEWKNGSSTTDEFSEALSIAMTTGVDESGSFSFAYTVSSLGINPSSTLGEPLEQCPSTYNVEQANVLVRYKTNTIVRSSLPIDDETLPTMNVSNSNQLYRAVSWGYRPIFTNSALESLYQKARDVLLTYVNDDMSDLEKVGAIYDWIVNNIDYDQAALVSTSDSRTSYNAFYLEGVFNDKCAVCDGKSKAFTLLCGMEGIKAERIMGYADKNLGTQKAKWLAGTFTPTDMTKVEGLSTGVPATESQIVKLMSSYGWGHAWNKVLLDTNGDNIKEWYVVDTTWGDISSVDIFNQYNITEYLSYDYFLVTDEDIEDSHFSIQEQNVANTEYDVYSETIEIGEEEVCIYIETSEQMTKIKNYCNENDGLVLILKLKSDELIKKTGLAYSIFASSVDVYYVHKANA